MQYLSIKRWRCHLEFNIGINNINNDNYAEVSDTLGKALKNIKQNAFGGNLDGFHFGGTNTILEENELFISKSQIKMSGMMQVQKKM